MVSVGVLGVSGSEVLGSSGTEVEGSSGVEVEGSSGVEVVGSSGTEVVGSSGVEVGNAAFAGSLFVRFFYSHHEHCISETVKTVLLLYSNLVCMHSMFISS